MKIQKIIMIFIFYFLFIINTYWEGKKYIFTDNLKVVSNNDLYNFEIKANFWTELKKEQFEYFKLVHSTINPDIKYENWNYIWYGDNINNKIATNFENYKPNEKWKNFYRVCMTTYETIFCSKNPLIIDKSWVKTITIDELSKIKTFLRDNKEAIDYISKNDYLSQNLWIKTNDLQALALSYKNAQDFLNIEEKIKYISQDLKTKQNIDNFLKTNENFNKTLENINKLKYEIDNYLDSILRSERIVWKYELTKTNNKKLNDFKYILEKEENELKSQNNQKTRTLTITSEKTTTNSWVEKSWTYNYYVNDNIDNWFYIEDYFPIFYTIWFLIFLFFIYKLVNSLKSDKSTKKYEPTINEYRTKENILQILKSQDEYIIEYNWIFNKWIKVLPQNKENITSSIYNYVNSVLKLQVRWKNLFEELKNLNVKIPDLKESWNTIYRLYIPENIREALKNQVEKEYLVIKTDEQEIPWEIMHDNDNFLSLKYAISRKIMTRENIRKNSFKQNKKPKILFITNPTLDLPWTIQETKEIINNLWNKAEIVAIFWKDVTWAKVFSLLWQDDFDIIHYSWHAYFDSKNPDNSWIILNDWIITCSEIKRLLNWNPLIFLNACSSWRNDDSDFEKTWEDTIWIASSFLIWWAKWVISTLWPVSDNVASDFASEFYTKFLNWNNIWESLLHSKKEVFIKYPKDITWASFIYYWDLDIKLKNK